MQKELKIALIAAVGKDNAIGINGKLPWKIKDDLLFYRRIIAGYPVIMGRRTYEGIGKPYPDQINIVVSSSLLPTDGTIICRNVQEGINYVRQLELETVYIIGGENIYREALQYATDLYITHVEAITEDADTFFPAVEWSQWVEIKNETMTFIASEFNEYPYRICHYQKLTA